MRRATHTAEELKSVALFEPPMPQPSSLPLSPSEEPPEEKKDGFSDYAEPTAAPAEGCVQSQTAFEERLADRSRVRRNAPQHKRHHRQGTGTRKVVPAYDHLVDFRSLTREQLFERAKHIPFGLDLYDVCRSPRTLKGPEIAILDQKVRLSQTELTEDLSCPICMGTYQTVAVVKDCLHRFCEECIERWLRTGHQDCPKCRKRIPSRRSLRADPIFQRIVRRLFPDVENFEKLNDRAVASMNQRKTGLADSVFILTSPKEGTTKPGRRLTTTGLSSRSSTKARRSLTATARHSTPFSNTIRDPQDEGAPDLESGDAKEEHDISPSPAAPSTPVITGCTPKSKKRLLNITLRCPSFSSSSSSSSSSSVTMPCEAASRDDSDFRPRTLIAPTSSLHVTLTLRNSTPELRNTWKSLECLKLVALKQLSVQQLQRMVLNSSGVSSVDNEERTVPHFKFFTSEISEEPLPATQQLGKILEQQIVMESSHTNQKKKPSNATSLHLYVDVLNLP